MADYSEWMKPKWIGPTTPYDMGALAGRDGEPREPPKAMTEDEQEEWLNGYNHADDVDDAQ